MTTNSLPSHFKASHENLTVHGLLASFLAFGGEETLEYVPWKATWPSLQDFQESMPLLWPEFLQEPLNCKGEVSPIIEKEEGITQPAFLLPPAIGGKWRGMLEYFDREDAGMLYRQREKLKADWHVVNKVFSDRAFLEYTYCWLIVNTRSFYFDILEGGKPKSHDDRMVMCPFVDYFNHKDHGVSLGQDALYNEPDTK